MATEITTNLMNWVVLTPNGTHHFISEQTLNDIYSASNEDLIELDDGVKIKVSMATEILPVDEYKKQFPKKFPTDYHQSYSNERDYGFKGVLGQARLLKDIEAFARGLKKAKDKKEKEGLTTKNIDNWIKLARKRYLIVKDAVVKPLTDKEKQEVENIKWVEENL